MQAFLKAGCACGLFTQLAALKQAQSADLGQWRRIIHPFFVCHWCLTGLAPSKPTDTQTSDAKSVR